MRLLERKPELPKAFEVPAYYRNGNNGNTQLLGTFLSWGANAHFLTNGGGAVHFLEHVRPLKTIDDFKPELITLENYDPHPVIKAELTVAGGYYEKTKDILLPSGEDYFHSRNNRK